MLLTQAHRPVCRLMETFWTFTSLVLLKHLESIWTLTIVTSWTIDTQMAAVVFIIGMALIYICKKKKKKVVISPSINCTTSTATSTAQYCYGNCLY